LPPGKIKPRLRGLQKSASALCPKGQTKDILDEGLNLKKPESKNLSNFFKPSAGANKAVKAEKIYHYGRLKSIC
jgi:hypothetical protein